MIEINLPSSPFGELLEKMEHLADAASSRYLQEVDRTLAQFQRSIEESFDALTEASRQTASALAIVSTELPKRGWYLSGKEPFTLIGELARHIESGNEEAIDTVLLEHAASVRLNLELFQQWLEGQGVPDYCISRIRLVLESRDEKNHEVATIVGVTVIDELCRHLYDDRDFTTKKGPKGRQQRPPLGWRGAQISAEPSSFAKEFIKNIGSIQDQTDHTRVNSEDYFNRHAILHGQMCRAYGPKDTEKVFMVLMFLVFGLDDEEASSEA